MTRLGEVYYRTYGRVKGWRTRTGAYMVCWEELDRQHKKAWDAAAKQAACGGTPSSCYAAYLKVTGGKAWGGSAAPGWAQLRDQAAWQAGAQEVVAEYPRLLAQAKRQALAVVLLVAVSLAVVLAAVLELRARPGVCGPSGGC